MFSLIAMLIDMRKHFLDTIETMLVRQYRRLPEFQAKTTLNYIKFSLEIY